MKEEERKIEEEHLRQNPYRTDEAAKEDILATRRAQGWATTESDLEYILDTYRKEGFLVEEEEESEK